MGEILKIQGLKVYFRQGKRTVKALDGVDIALPAGKVTALAGESGCGKTTLAKAILQFCRLEAGNIYLNGKDISLRKNEPDLRSNIQIVFQNPFASLDPRYTVFFSLYEVLRVFKRVNKREARSILVPALAEVGLDEEVLARRPQELSGGQIQRACIARALLNKPALVILDEPTSSLDVTTSLKIIHLLKKIQHRSGLTFLFISHNLRLLKKISDFCFIMQAGKVVESGPKEAVYNNPVHPYTQLLLRASDYQLK